MQIRVNVNFLWLTESSNFLSKIMKIVRTVVSTNLGPLRFPSKSFPPGAADAQHYFFIVVCGPRSRNSCPKIVRRLCAPVKGFHTGLRCAVSLKHTHRRQSDGSWTWKVRQLSNLSLKWVMAIGVVCGWPITERAKTQFSVYSFIFIRSRQLANGSESSPFLGESRKSK